MMRVKEKWVAWDTGDKLVGDYEIVKVEDYSERGFVITYESQDNNKRVDIVFGFGVASYRSTSEIYMFRFRDACSSDRSYTYKVLDSKYIQWLADVSEGLSTDMEQNLQHYVFVSEDDYIEVLSRFEPDIELITRE